MTYMSAAGILLGCATKPVTGRSQLMLVLEEKGISMDRENSPHQFSADYSKLQDKQLDAYLSRPGKNISANTHRPQKPVISSIPDHSAELHVSAMYHRFSIRF